MSLTSKISFFFITAFDILKNRYTRLGISDSWFNLLSFCVHFCVKYISYYSGHSLSKCTVFIGVTAFSVL